MHDRPAWGRRVAVALLAATLVSGCNGSGPEPARRETTRPAAVSPVPRPISSPVPSSDPLVGTWWIFSEELPFRAFRVNLNVGDADFERKGLWVTFNWKATTDAELLVGRSKPVTILAEEDGEKLIVQGPSPMLTEGGEPNGQSGNWKFELRQASLPDEPERYAGRAWHDQLTPPEGIAASLERNYRAVNK